MTAADMPTAFPPAVAQRAGGSTSGHPVLPPSSPRQSLGVGDGVDTPPPHGVSPTDGGAGCPQAPGSAIPFDLLLRGWR